VQLPAEAHDTDDTDAFGAELALAGSGASTPVTVVIAATPAAGAATTSIPAVSTVPRAAATARTARRRITPRIATPTRYRPNPAGLYPISLLRGESTPPVCRHAKS
jgi:hypothetical protein